jgi:hypothetical protein
VADSGGVVLHTAADELADAVARMTGRRPTVQATLPGHDAFIVCTLAEARRKWPQAAPSSIGTDGFWLGSVQTPAVHVIVIAGAGARGAVYGVFALERAMSLGTNLATINQIEDAVRAAALGQRVGQPDGSIERGYGGRSVFFRDNHCPPGSDDRRRSTRACWRQSAVNACVVNSVNTNPLVMTDGFLPELARLSEVFPSMGHPDGARGRLLDAENDRRSRHVRPPGAGRHRLLEGTRGRRLSCGSGSRRVRAEGRFGRPARALGLRPHPRRRRQCDRAGAAAARRRVLLSRLRLRPPHGLAAT